MFTFFLPRFIIITRMDDNNGLTGLAEHDPYREIGESTRAGLRPTLPGDDARKKSAAENLLAAEKTSSSASGSSDLSGGQSDALSAESELSFKNSVAGVARKEPKGKFRFSAKKHGPIVALVFLLCALGFLIFGSQTLMPFAIVNRFIEEFNTNGISSVLRSDNILDLQLSGGGLFGISEDQKSSLREVGIIPFNVSDGTVALAYRKGKEYNVVYGSSSSEDRALASAGSNVPGDLGDAVLYSDALNDKDFKNPYTTASKTWRGGSSGWYDSLMSINEIVRDFSRSRYFQTNTSRIASFGALYTGRTGMRYTFRDGMNWVKGKMRGSTLGGTEAANSDGSGETVTGTGKGILTAAAITSGLSGLGNITCQALQIVSKAQTLVTAFQNNQLFNLLSGYLESVQMVQAGDSDGTVMNTYNNRLMEEDPDTGKNSFASSGMTALFSGTEIKSNDESVMAINSESAMANMGSSESGNAVIDLLGKAASGFTNIVKAMEMCNYVSGTLNVISTVLTVVGIATGGVGALIKFGIQTIVTLAVSPVINRIKNELAEKVLTWLWDKFGNTFLKDMAAEWIGPDLGNALVAGANLYVSSNHQTGGGTPAGKNQVVDFKRSQEVVIAQEAEYQRSIRSPFDVSSQYTFLGSLAYNLIPFSVTSSSGNILKNISSLTVNSVTKLLPSASAIAETQLIDSFGECPVLDSLGIAGDAYCRPYIISESSTQTTKPEAIIEKVQSLGGLGDYNSETKTYEIKKNSNLEKFINFCGQRLSNWGYADSNIADKIKENAASAWWRKIPLIGSLIGSIADIVDNKENMQWISGLNCVDSEKNARFWNEEGQYYQRFAEDQRLLESIGTVEKNSIALYLEDYYQKNPLDNSFEGVLARWSGMSKDDVIATLDTLEGLYYIANYKPEERLAFGKPEAEKIYFEDTNEVEDSTLALEPKYIIYNDVRNRVFSV